MNVWLNLGRGILLGCALALLYGFLRPFRPRWLGDLLFIYALFGAWVRLIFGFCAGDPRFAYTMSLFAGFLLWEVLFGSILYAVFSSFWKRIYRSVDGFLALLKKILKKSGLFLISLYAKSKKWVTIKCNNPPGKAENRRNSHGIPQSF